MGGDEHLAPATLLHRETQTHHERDLRLVRDEPDARRFDHHVVFARRLVQSQPVGPAPSPVPDADANVLGGPSLRERGGQQLACLGADVDGADVVGHTGSSLGANCCSRWSHGGLGRFRKQAGADGRVDLAFNRIYLVAVKP
jgi:hypothetical protein